MASKSFIFALRNKNNGTNEKNDFTMLDGSIPMKELTKKLKSQFGVSDYALCIAEGVDPTPLSPAFFEVYGNRELHDLLQADRPIGVYEVTFVKVSVVISSGSPNTLHTVNMCTEDNVLLLKQLIERRINIPADEQVLTITGKGLGGSSIEDTTTLAQSNIGMKTIVQVTQRQRGGASSSGGKSFGMIDIFNNKAVRDRNFAPAPRWRIVAPGLNAKGRCHRKRVQCDAAGQSVSSQQGFGTFSFHEINGRCPECRNKIELTNLLFSDCFFKVRAVGTDSEAEKIIHWTKVGHYYRTWDPEEAGVKQWKSMEIIARPTNQAMAVPRNRLVREAPISNSCSICMRTLAVGSNVTMLSCTHSFHTSCHEAWLRRREGACSICSSTQ